MKQNALCKLCGTCSQTRTQPEFFWGSRANHGGANFLHEVLGSKAKLWGLGAPRLAAGSNKRSRGGAPSVCRFFVIF